MSQPTIPPIRTRLTIESDYFTITPEEGTYVVAVREQRDEAAGSVPAAPIGVFREEAEALVFCFAEPRSADVLIEDEQCVEFIRLIQKAGQLFEADREPPG